MDPNGNKELKNELDRDCLSCKLVGSVGAFGIGSYLIYNSFRVKNAWFLRAASIVPFYVSAARVLYWPPFASLKIDD